MTAKIINDLGEELAILEDTGGVPLVRYEDKKCYYVSQEGEIWTYRLSSEDWVE